jgi:hypothetical protein
MAKLKNGDRVRIPRTLTGRLKIVTCREEYSIDARRLEAARRLLTGLDPAIYGPDTDAYAEENAALAIDTARKNDFTQDDILTSASNYRTFIESATDKTHGPAYLARFCMVVELLRRKPRRTRH